MVGKHFDVLARINLINKEQKCGSLLTTHLLPPSSMYLQNNVGPLLITLSHLPGPIPDDR